MMGPLTLGSLAHVIKGSTPANTSPNREGPLFFGQTEVSADGVGAARFLIAGTDLSRATPLRSGDLVICLLGSHVGRSAGVSREYDGAILGRECAVVRIHDPALLTAGWLRAWTKTDDFRKQVKKEVTGVTMPRLRAAALATFSVPLPDLETQRSVERLANAFDEAFTSASRHLAGVQELRDVQMELTVRSALEGRAV